MKNKLFNNTQWRLSILFTIFLIIFLITFIMITYFSLVSIVKKEQEDKVLAWTNEDLDDRYEDLLEWYWEEDHQHKRKDYHERKEDREYNDHFRTFYFVIAEDGTVIDEEGINNAFLREILDKTSSTSLKEGEVRKLIIADETILLAAQTIYEHGQYVGTIYAGTNISDETEIIHTLLSLLIFFAIIFIILSALLGYWMAGKAMVPILNAFDKQKQFTADASHELRTPLSVMQSSLEVIEAEERDKLSPFSVKVLEDLKDEVKRMTHLVNELLILARSDLNNKPIQKKWFSLTNVLEKLQRKFQYEVEKYNVQLFVSIPSELEAFGDEEKITQLLYILIDNACKYNVPNGRINISAWKEANQIRIDVTDTGIGIAPEHQQRIFDRFYRVDKARSREQGSSGLGLSIAKWIIQIHKGKIIVKSEEGKGSTFSIFLPLPK